MRSVTRSLLGLAIALGLASTLSCGPDPDGDGSRGRDCAPLDATVYPGADELCNGIDDDCDAEIDEEAVDPFDFWLDADGDGYGTGEVVAACSAPPDYVAVDGDCDDASADRFPGADEVCGNGFDDNCNGEPDQCVWSGEIPSELSDIPIPWRSSVVTGWPRLDRSDRLAMVSTDSGASPELAIWDAPLAAVREPDNVMSLDGVTGQFRHLVAVGEERLALFDTDTNDVFVIDEAGTRTGHLLGSSSSVVLLGESEGALWVTQSALFRIEDPDVSGDIGDVASTRIDGVRTSAAHSADVDGDGVLDLVAGEAQHQPGGEVRRPGRALVFLGPFPATLTGADADLVVTGTTDDAGVGYAVETGDVDDDGVAELVLDSSERLVQLPYRPGQIPADEVIDAVVLPEYYDPRGLGVAQVDDDAADEILVGRPQRGDRTGEVYVFLDGLQGRTDMSDASAVFTGSSMGSRIDVSADLDGDGRFDFIDDRTSPLVLFLGAKGL